MEMLFFDPTEIKVKEGFDRYRQDMGDIESLARSIKEKRQILPIIITRDKNLIDGGRRLAACLLINKQVLCVYQDVIDDLEMRELELEANLHRKDYTPAERILAIKNLHTMKQERLGEANYGPGDMGGHSIADTAKLIGKSKKTVIDAIEMAAMIEAFPQLAGAKTQSQIKKAGKSLMKLGNAIANSDKMEKALKDKEDLFLLHKDNAEEHMKQRADKSVNILLTDPPYGIEASTLAINIGGQTGGDLTSSGFNLSDTVKEGLKFYQLLAIESFRFCADDAHGFIFVAPEHFNTIRFMFVEAGWRAYIKPIIWIKRATGQCNVPHAWPASCYEMILYIRKDESRLIQEGKPDWEECAPVSSTNKIHQWEKPVELLVNLLKRVALPGQTLYDPFMGSGSSIEAGVQMKLFSIGCDNAVECYAYAMQRLTKATEVVNNTPHT